MRRFQPLGALLFIGALSLSLAAVGCGKKERSSTNVDEGDEQADGDGGGGGKKKKLTEQDVKEWGTLVGTVTYEGSPPVPPKIKMEGNPNEAQCHQNADPDELVEQTWLVDKDSNGVADVVIYLKAPEGKFFKVHPDYEKKKKEPAVLRQPHCAFIPHALPFWAGYYDRSGKLKATGTVVKAVNDAKVNHNTQAPGQNKNLSPGGSFDLDFKVNLEAPIPVTCSIHPWMNAKIALDTPYLAHTNHKGQFKIDHVPAGVDVYVVAWHDDAPKNGFFNGGAGGTKRKFEPGKETKLDLKVKKGS